ncbi:MAG TPA: DUF397 domain-containing protein [Kineosporiaceae bacterium]|nr:DUF397 domain-containing protein [Kineosporiaceae bacterium]
MNVADGEDGEWISSSTAPADGGRVQMRRRTDGGVDVRDSAHPDTVLHFTKAEFEAWLDGVSKREFHHLATDT